jgi:phosphotransferase system  glucose/maltose/N-acetylglucosamine-specific IIC component/phosphotransferase system IIB component
MKRRISYEHYVIPIGIVLLGCVFLTLGSLLTNLNGTFSYEVDSDVVIGIGTVLYRAGNFMIVNFPLWFGLKIAMRDEEKYIAAAAVLLGYGTYLVVTMLVSQGSLGTEAYSSILGISYTKTEAYTGSTTTCYPLQTGIIGGIIAGVIVRTVVHHVHAKALIHSYSALGENGRMILASLFWCALAGLLVALAWPAVYQLIGYISDAVSASTGGFQMFVYGIMDQILSLFNLNALTRIPFWYGTEGGTWTSVAGTAYNGDVNIWMAVISTGKLSADAGKYITPYYILHIFALPAGLAAVFSMSTDGRERKRSGMILFIAALASIFGGTDLPLLIGMLILCPMLLGIHIILTGCLFGICRVMNLNLGYRTVNQVTMTAQPGSLSELVSYARYDFLQDTVTKVVIIGIIFAIIYFIIVRMYFKHFAIGLFDPDRCNEVTEKLLKALGGLDNVKEVSASFEHLTVSLYDEQIVDQKQLAELHIDEMIETKDAYILPTGAPSWMIRQNIRNRIRANSRDV